jgi:hypothetical protein
LDAGKHKLLSELISRSKKMNKKKKIFWIIGTALVFALIMSFVFIACNLDPESDPAQGGHREEVPDENLDLWTKNWEGYSKDNLPSPDYWNRKGENWIWPDIFTKIDGTKVTTKAQWAERYGEIKEILQYYLYGYLPPTPTVTASTTYAGTGNTVAIAITLTANGKTANVSANITLPSNRSIYPDGVPVSFGGTAGVDGARGFAIMGVPGYDSAITTLFQFSSSDPDHGGDLINTAWSCGRVIDAIEQLTAEGQPLAGVLARDKFTITGHSRGGKDAIVGAAFEPRIDVSSPSSSGALGLAPERFIRTVVKPTNGVGTHGGNPEGKGWYYMSAPRGSNDSPKNYVLSYLVPGVAPPTTVRVYGPIQSIQGYDHARYDGTASGDFGNGRKSTWVSNRFLEFSRFRIDQFWTSENGYEGKGSMAQVPFDQHFLTALMAGPDPEHPRAIVMSAGNEGDSWVHPEGTYINYLVTLELYKFLGKPELLIPIMDNTGGHIHTNIRRERQADLCDYMWRNVPLPANIMDLSSEPGYELYGYGAEYPLDIRSLDDYHLIQIKNPADPQAKSISEIADEYFATHNHY